jgi:hypothetical protein
VTSFDMGSPKLLQAVHPGWQSAGWRRDPPMRCLLIAPISVDVRVLFGVLADQGVGVLSASELGAGEAAIDRRIVARRPLALAVGLAHQTSW